MSGEEVNDDNKKEPENEEDEIEKAGKEMKKGTGRNIAGAIGGAVTGGVKKASGAVAKTVGKMRDAKQSEAPSGSEKLKSLQNIIINNFKTSDKLRGWNNNWMTKYIGGKGDLSKFADELLKMTVKDAKEMCTRVTSVFGNGQVDKLGTRITADKEQAAKNPEVAAAAKQEPENKETSTVGSGGSDKTEKPTTSNNDEKEIDDNDNDLKNAAEFLKKAVFKHKDLSSDGLKTVLKQHGFKLVKAT